LEKRGIMFAAGPLYPRGSDVPEAGMFVLRANSFEEADAIALGSKGFWDFELVTDCRALVPRPETELLVEKALACLAGREQETLHLLDLGTGTGAVALALARASDRWRVTATDVEADALVLAQDNAARLGVGNVSFLQSDWFASLGADRFDLVASNPPYIAHGDPHLQREGLPFEPRRALVADENGFAALGAIAGAASAFLRPGGWLLLEHGFTQGASVRELLLGAGFGDLRCWQDLAGLDRVTQARAHR
jgi:release factor glutamine methyltransferase